MQKNFLFLGLFILAVTLIFSRTTLSSQNNVLSSPWAGRGVLGVNLWFPKNMSFASNPNTPDITAKAAYFIDTDSGEVLYQKEPHLRLPVASLTKIMTAIVALENHDWEDEILVSSRAAGMEPDHMQLIAGEKLTVEELLYGVFLVSANDGAESLAGSLTGSSQDFVTQMNSKAIQLGMKDTVFINPTGLQEDDKSQYSTAYDVALMSRYLIKRFPKVTDISSTYHIVLPLTSTHQDYDLYSGINLLTTYSGVVGLKTGYTPEAGLTLVTLARKNGHEILGVILNSENRREEARELLDYSFKQIGG